VWRRHTVKTIVLFGDSNTWGFVPGSDGQRFPRDVRWPGRLATALGETAEVIEEGLNGRMATIEHPAAEGRSGLPYLLPCLRTPRLICSSSTSGPTMSPSSNP
jgi:lysophospholipase L1-like esterase